MLIRNRDFFQISLYRAALVMAASIPDSSAVGIF